MISFKQLTYALAAAETLHFKKAADKCHVSQSALSTALSQLEEQLGVQIFERDNKKVLVTPIGQEVLARAAEIVAQVHSLQNLSSSLKEPLSFPLSVGVIPTIAPYLLPKMFPTLNKRFPNAELRIVEEQSHVLVEKVRKGELDTAILALPYECEGLLTMEFWQEDFFWVTLKGDKYSQQKEITSDEMMHSNLMLLKEGHCLKDHILDACKLSEEETEHGFGATSLNTLIQMVLGKLGTTLIPEMALDQLISQNKELSAVHLKEPGPHRRIAFIIRPNFTRLSSVEALKDVCKDALAGNGA
ncbi:hydrogen peroxide-inducible genes activator [Kangiella aquimarina]|uniref:LysR substrate-binding domain-containing protein n=1 Tax=Kangiella aquimarina TaxID=261965 RepID=A0ABZ0X4U7_9GAMM|nr:hydrogen peroxide-inducible genes activator [Kangiella aquimarina]WQG85545.1 LysR substrate-binding domain-containing protein [Kangiella aquimarina]